VDLFLKPAWDPVLLSGVNYVNHLSLYRRERLMKIGLLRDGFQGSQDYDLLLRYTSGLESGQVLHLPYPAYVWRRDGASHSVRFVHDATNNARRALLEHYSVSHPGVAVSAQILPSAPGAVHQYLLTSLEGRTREFDVFVADVIWVAELARAGWVRDLSAAFPAEIVRRDFLPGPASAVLVQGGTFAVPWYVDVGVLYHRTDLVPSPPRTYADLVEAARGAARKRSLHGYVWQGLQSEGLVCNAFETIWGFGGAAQDDGRVLVDTEAAREALEFMRTLLVSGLSPPSVTSMGEEESRRVFQSGAAVLMRNWPYAWAELQGKGSPVRGRVGIASLPSARGGPGPPISGSSSSPDARRPRGAWPSAGRDGGS